MNLSVFLDTLYHLVWGMPLMILLMATGVFYTIFLGGLQFRYLGYALKLVFGKEAQSEEGKGDITHFQSLMTALAASVGIGNIAGVAVALTVGGMGALFWMWVVAFLGMATKYAESILAVKYRSQDQNGKMCGGPMYFIEKGLGWRWLGVLFALFGSIVALCGGNMLQSNSLSDVMATSFGIDPIWTGAVVAIFTGVTLMGGIRSIGKLTSYLVPIMAIIYLGGGLCILALSLDCIPFALYTIVSSAFSGQAAFGGFAGSSFLLAMQIGISRGLMTSEAGLGTASIASAAAKTDFPGRQAMVSMTGAFLGTVVMCSVTGLVLAVTDVFGQVDSSGKLLTGATLTVAAFSSVFSWGGTCVTLGMIFFAFTTILGWAYYGEKCVEYLVGEQLITPYRCLFTSCVFIGAILNLETVWRLSDIFNGLMAFPNVIGLLALATAVKFETRRFLQVV